MPAPPQLDRFAQAAGRHLADSEILAAGSRLDNAVYLAGYVVECSLKAVISHHLGVPAARHYRHDLAALQGRALQQLRTLVPHVDFRVPASRTQGTVLDTGHPERRYWASGRWTQQEVEAALKRASEIYCDTVVAMVLNGDLSDRELIV
jgi:HEPN domain-containing protein